MQIKKFTEMHEFIMNADVRLLCNVSAVTANRILAGLVSEGKLTKYCEGGHWAYSQKSKVKNRIDRRLDESYMKLVII